MNSFETILALRDKQGDSTVLHLIAKAFAATPNMMVQAPEHQWLIDYLAFDQAASERSFKFAVRKYPAFTTALIARCRVDDADSPVAALLESLAEGKPKPIGVVREAFSAEHIAENLPTYAGEKLRTGVLAMAQGMRGALTASPRMEVESELMFAWAIVEEMVLDAVVPIADRIDCTLPVSLVKAQAQNQAVEDALRGQTAAEMFKAFFTDPAPCVLAHASDDDEAAVPPEAMTAIPVSHHHSTKQRAAPQQLFLQSHAVAKQLADVYAVVNGAALFCTQYKHWLSAGFLLLSDKDWYPAHCQILEWLEALHFKDDPTQIPTWVKTAIPFGKIPGDASFWIMPVEGPYAGAVMLSHDDISDEHVRYPSFDVFIATLRLYPEAILSCGGYVSYDDPSDGGSLYPQGYRTGNSD